VVGDDEMDDNSEAWATREFEVGMSFFRASDCPVDLAGDLERALVALSNAEIFFGFASHPEKWAEIRATLGGIYLLRRKGGKFENLSLAINCYTDALIVYDRTSHSFEWAKCQSELGRVFSGLGNGTDHVFKDRALRHFESALTVITKENWPELWHGIHLDLSILHQKYATYSSGEDLALAEENAQAAFELDRDKYPELYAAMLSKYNLNSRLLELLKEKEEASNQ
jgi:tetratricopeptide (TPR) repeat protein